MLTVTAHFDGKNILLDEPLELEPDTKLMVTVLANQDSAHDNWLRLSRKGLARSYAEDEEEYSLSDLKVHNPDYGRS